MKTLQILLTSSLLLLLTACATNVYTVNPSNNDLSNYETFAYLPNTNVEVEGKNYTDTNINKSIVESVKMNLEKHGMEVDQDQPELLVLISTSAKVDIDAVESSNYATYPYQKGAVVSPIYEPYYYYEYETVTSVDGYKSTTYTHEEGTLVIDLIDKETKKTVWKGVAIDRIYDDPSPEIIKNMVNDIFDEFPVRKEEA